MRSLFKTVNINWLFLATVFAAFAPTLFFHFQYHNDLGYWFDREFGPHPETGHLFYFGRPFGGMLLDLQTNILRMFPTLTALTISRFVSLIFIVIFFYLTEKILRRFTNLTGIQRSVFLLVIALQPPWYEAYVWTSNLTPGILSYILGIVSFLLYSKNTKKSWRDYFAAGSLLAVSFLIYPPGTCVFFWGVFILCSFGKEEYKFRQVILDGAFFASVCLLCLVFHKIVVMGPVCDSYWAKCVSWESPTSKAYSWSLFLNPLEKLEVLWNLTVVTSVSWIALLTKVNAIEALPGLSLLALAFGPFTSKGGIQFTKQDWFKGFGYSLLFLFVLNVPNLVTNGAVIAFRTVAPNTIFFAVAMVKILSVFKNQNIQKSIAAMSIGTLVILCIVSSLKLVDHYETAWAEVTSDPQVRELCKNGPRIGPRFAVIPVVAKYLRPGYFSDADGLDLDLPVFLQDSTPSICYLLENE